MDQNIEILNQIAANSAKVEALHATITSILNEMHARHSIMDNANLDQQRYLEVSYEAPSIANRPAEHNPRDLELASTTRASILDLRTIRAIDARNVSSPTGHAGLTQSTPDISGDLLSEANRKLAKISGAQKREVADHWAQEPFSVPERSMARHDREQLYADVWSTPLRNEITAGKPAEPMPPFSTVKVEASAAPIPVPSTPGRSPRSEDTCASTVTSITGAQFRMPSMLRNRYDRDRLYEGVWTSPMRTLARQYGVSDSALRKICCRLAVPIPPRGYWNKVAAGKQVIPRPQLPPVRITESLAQRSNHVYTAEERNSILAQIARDISFGETLFAACLKAGIWEKTYRRWHRAKSASLPADALGIKPEPSKTDQDSSNSAKENSRAHLDSGHQPLAFAAVTGTGSCTRTDRVTQECQKTVPKSTLDQIHNGPRPTPSISANLNRVHDREKLYEEVWSMPISRFADKYGVSAVTVRRRCRQLHVPVPALGHWRRLETGLPVQQRPPLPNIQIIDEEKKEWMSNVYSSEEIIQISQRISDAVVTGKTLKDACREAGIAITTYRRWRKRLAQSADAKEPAARDPEIEENAGMRKRYHQHSAEEIANLYREINNTLRSGKPLYVALQDAEISQSTYYRWRNDCAEIANIDLADSR